MITLKISLCRLIRARERIRTVLPLIVNPLVIDIVLGLNVIHCISFLYFKKHFIFYLDNKTML